MGLTARAKLLIGSGLLLVPLIASADVAPAPKCGCTIDGTSVGLGWLLLAGITALVIRYRRR